MENPQFTETGQMQNMWRNPCEPQKSDLEIDFINPLHRASVPLQTCESSVMNMKSKIALIGAVVVIVALLAWNLSLWETEADRQRNETQWKIYQDGFWNGTEMGMMSVFNTIYSSGKPLTFTANSTNYTLVSMEWCGAWCNQRCGNV